MNYIGALAIDGNRFDFKTRLQKALEMKMFEDQKDTIKLTSLVSSVVDTAAQEKMDVVKSRLIRNDPGRPIVVAIREEKQRKPDSVAVIIYMMDVSGSMSDEQKKIVRIEAFWIDTWIKAHYQGIATVCIIHDAAAQEVDEHTFYHMRESGGTKISSAYELAEQIISPRGTVAPPRALRE
jgi:uncharacterized sporulation protein YeaH/YhbH (DUF444 family)